MGVNNSDNRETGTFNGRRSRFEDTGTGKSLRVNETESSSLSVIAEPEEIRIEPLPLNSRLKKTGLSGYRRSSVEAYVDEMKRSTNQLRDNMEKQIQTLSAECMRLKSESQVLRGQLVEAEEQTSQVRDMLTAVTNERDAAEHRITETASELKSMEDRVSVFEAENAVTEELKNALREKDDELAGAAAENGRLKEQIKDFSVRVNHINDEFLKYKERKSAETEEMEQLRQELNSLRQDNTALKSELSGTKQELDRMAGLEAEREAARLAEEKEREERRQEEQARAREDFSDFYPAYRDEKSEVNPPDFEDAAAAELMEEFRRKDRENASTGHETEGHGETGKLQDVINILLNELQNQQKLYDGLSAERRENKELIYNLTRDGAQMHMQNIALQDKNAELAGKITALEEENARLNRIIKQSRQATVIPFQRPERQTDDDDRPGNRFSIS